VKILSPLSKPFEAGPLAEAGATEFYCGIVTKEWEDKFSYIASSNLRHDKVANFSSFKDLSLAVEAGSEHNVPVFCVFNAHFYSEKQMALVLNHVGQAIDAGVSKIIVSDPVFISMLKKQGFKTDIVLSTANPVFNSASLGFFKKFGIQRIVLPRHLTVKEIEGLAKSAKKLGLELEAFVLNALCPYIDGLCTLQHLGKNSDFVEASELACRMPFKTTCSGKACNETGGNSSSLKACVWQNTETTSCGLCALKSFEKAGINSLKIAGRGNSFDKKLADVKMIKHALSLLDLPEEEFKSEMHGLFFKANKQRCDFKYCYYPNKGLL